MLRFAIELIRFFWVLAREGVLALFPLELAPLPARLFIKAMRIVERKNKGSSADQPLGSGIVSALERLGPSYIKMGQFLATRPDIVGLDLARQLAVLQDKMPPFDQKQALRQIEIQLGVPWQSLFEEISEPVAAASIAQVHRARTKGEGPYKDVAVKVMRPDVEARFAKDIKVLSRIAKFNAMAFPFMRRLKPVETVELMRTWIRHELDFRLEAGALSEYAQTTEKDERIRVPGLDWERTSKGVITLEWIDGHRVDDIAAHEAQGLDPAQIGDNVLSAFLHQALNDGYFHGDMHPGNLLVDQDGKIVVLDYGIMGRLGRKERRFLAEILYGFIKRDYRRVAEVHFEAGYVPKSEDIDEFAQALRAVGEPIYNQSAENISMARLFTLLFEITDLFKMAARMELILLQKTMVAVEGLARTLNPNFNMWNVAEPVLKQWLAYHLGPQGRVVELKDAAHVLWSRSENLPEKLTNALDVLDGFAEMGAKGVKLDAQTLYDLQKPPAKNRALTVGVWALVVLAGLNLFFSLV